VKFNALTHGLTAESTIIPSVGFEENREEFDALHLHLRSELEPQGVMEELLVKKIAITFWRQRRLLKAEVGEIEKNWDHWKHNRDEELERSEGLAETSPMLFPPLKHYTSYADGIIKLIAVLEEARKEIKDLGYTSTRTQGMLIRYFGERGDACVAGIVDIGDRIAYQQEKESEGLDDADEYDEDNDPPVDMSNAEEVKKMCLQLTDHAISKYTELLDTVRANEEHQQRIHRYASCLPSAEVSDRFLRYQTALERQLQDAMRQLEHLQDRRQAKSSAKARED
jgi:hypothetical protein